MDFALRYTPALLNIKTMDKLPITKRGFLEVVKNVALGFVATPVVAGVLGSTMLGQVYYRERHKKLSEYIAAEDPSLGFENDIGIKAAREYLWSEYKIVVTTNTVSPPHDTTYSQVESKKMKSALSKLIFELRAYPKGVFKNEKLVIRFVENLDHSGDIKKPGGIYYPATIYPGDILINMTNKDLPNGATIHHEIFHHLEYIHDGYDKPDNEWKAEHLKYCACDPYVGREKYASTPKDLHTDIFSNSYGRSEPLEDRASWAETLFVSEGINQAITLLRMTPSEIEKEGPVTKMQRAKIFEIFEKYRKWSNGEMTLAHFVKINSTEFVNFTYTDEQRFALKDL